MTSRRANAAPSPARRSRHCQAEPGRGHKDVAALPARRRDAHSAGMDHEVACGRRDRTRPARTPHGPLIRSVPFLPAHHLASSGGSHRTRTHRLGPRLTVGASDRPLKSSCPGGLCISAPNATHGLAAPATSSTPTAKHAASTRARARLRTGWRGTNDRYGRAGTLPQWEILQVAQRKSWYERTNSPHV